MVSVIVPVYNVEKYIFECLNSLKHQTYKNLQVIIIDDGSTDNSLKIVRKFSNSFKNFLLLTQENKGVSEARNLALSYVKGDYVLFVDSDDFLDCTMIERMYLKAKRYDSDICICGYNLYYKENCINNKRTLYKLQEERVYNNEAIIDLMMYHKLQGQLWNKLFKTHLLKKIKFRFELGRYIQDIFPVFTAVCNSSSITYVNKSLYYYRQIESSTIHKKNLKLANDYYFAMTSILNYINDKNIKVKKNSLLTFKSFALCIFCLHLMNSENYDNYKSLKNSKYKDLILEGKQYIYLSNLPINVKVKLLLIQSDFYYKIKKIKKFLNNIILLINTKGSSEN